MVSEENLKKVGLIIAFLTFLAIAYPIVDPKPKPIVSIVSPGENEQVPRDITVNGTQLGVLPEGHYIWIMVNPTWASDQWWPQYGRPVQPVNNKWSVTAVIGNDSNSGKEFNIAAILVDSAGNEKIKNWEVSAPALDYQQSMSLPDNAEIMAAVRVKRI